MMIYLAFCSLLSGQMLLAGYTQVISLEYFSTMFTNQSELYLFSFENCPFKVNSGGHNVLKVQIQYKYMQSNNIV